MGYRELAGGLPASKSGMDLHKFVLPRVSQVNYLIRELHVRSCDDGHVGRTGCGT